MLEVGQWLLMLKQRSTSIKMGVKIEVFVSNRKTCLQNIWRQLVRLCNELSGYRLLVARNRYYHAAHRWRWTGSFGARDKSRPADNIVVPRTGAHLHVDVSRTRFRWRNSFYFSISGGSTAIITGAGCMNTVPPLRMLCAWDVDKMSEVANNSNNNELLARRCKHQHNVILFDNSWALTIFVGGLAACQRTCGGWFTFICTSASECGSISAWGYMWEARGNASQARYDDIDRASANNATPKEVTLEMSFHRSFSTAEFISVL